MILPNAVVLPFLSSTTNYPQLSLHSRRLDSPQCSKALFSGHHTAIIQVEGLSWPNVSCSMGQMDRTPKHYSAIDILVDTR